MTENKEKFWMRFLAVGSVFALAVAIVGCVQPPWTRDGAKVSPSGGKAVTPSEFAERQLNAGDTMEIVKVVAGG